MTLPPLPKPFTSLPLKGSQTTSIHVWASDQVQAYAEAAVLAEREACAKACVAMQHEGNALARNVAFLDAAAAIRSRT